MFDVRHLPLSPPEATVQVFTLSCLTEWVTWCCPRGVSMLNILCVGGGGSGGGGATSNANGGGGGGGSSGITRVLIPALYLPQVLYVRVGAGGEGVAAGTAGNAGILSYVAIAPNIAATNVVAISGAAGAGGGAAGTAGGAAGGTAGSIAPITGMPLAGMGQFAFIAGQAGTTGGTSDGTLPGAVAIPVTSTLCQGGGGGGGNDGSIANAGSLMTAITASFLSQQRPSAAAAISGNAGSGGRQLWNPLWSFGGMGGSAHFTATGGAGANGAYGSGGGGGGAGPTAGGRGGAGGSGYVILIAT